MFIPYRRKVYCDHYMCSLIDAEFKSYRGIHFNCSPHKPCKYAFQNSRMEKVIYADYESYLGLNYDCYPLCYTGDRGGQHVNFIHYQLN